MPEHQEPHIAGMVPVVVPEHEEPHTASMVPVVVPEHEEPHTASMVPVVVPEHANLVLLAWYRWCAVWSKSACSAGPLEAGRGLVTLVCWQCESREAQMARWVGDTGGLVNGLRRLQPQGTPAFA